MSARNWALGLAVGAVLAAGSPTALAAGPDAPLLPAARTLRAPLPDGLGPCVPGECPSPFPQIGSDGSIKGRDNAVNIFAGGQFRVRGRASEAEGRLVVLGGFDQDKLAGGDSRYTVGIVGAGSLVPPPDGADFLTTGADVTVAANETLIADRGVVRYAGTLTGTVTGTRTRDTAAVTPYAGLRDRLTAASQCYAYVDGRPRTATGTVANSGFETLFTGDGTSPLQVFTVDADLVGARGGAQGVRFARIPAGATILVNVLGAGTRTINTYSGTLVDAQDPLNAHRERLLWNFPDAATVNLNGSGQFQGSFLMGNQTSETTVTLPGINGRFFTTGSVTHGSETVGGGGQEFHAYPFTGNLPDCGSAPAPTGAVAVTKVDENGAPLAGATFELWHETNGAPGLQTDGTGADAKVTDCTTPPNGTCRHTEAALGTYYWRETAAPAGHDLPANPVFPLTLTRENASAGVGVRVVNPTTTAPGARVVLHKTDRDTGAALPGARFELWRETNDRAGLQTLGEDADERLDGLCVTDARGSCTVELPVDETYYWRETGLPAGYEPPQNPVTAFELTPGDVVRGIVVTVTNRKKGEEHPGSLRVLKKDAKTGRPLHGAVFEVWKETNNTPGLQTRGINADQRAKDGCATDRAGVCDFDGLSEGSYYLVETDVPEGYVLPRDRVTGPLHVTARAPGNRVEVTLHNKRDEHGKGKQDGKHDGGHEGKHDDGHEGKHDGGHDGDEEYDEAPDA
ncbi:choice-of-anchor A family protein [Streptomyces sp. NPDC059564]|uniref:choice-of-anchor A family protein n=1 Tax=Streptomyces sp. NPDC059564 TaxID=3346865 RepID=UPI00369D810F